MKKLIIVTLMIMVASCAAVKQTSRFAEELSPRADSSRTSLPGEGLPGRSVSEANAAAAKDNSSVVATGHPVPESAEDQDHLILATLWYQKSAEMRALYYQCFRNAETALKESLALSDYTIVAAEAGMDKRPVRSEPALPEAEAATSEHELLSGHADAAAGSVHAETFPVQGKVKLPAVVIDIDETLLDNSPFQGWQVHEKKSFNNEDWFRWVELARARPLPGAVEFTRCADSLGVEVFYVSNRTVQEMGPTIENMATWGFVNADSTHMLLKETTSSKVERQAIIEKNYEILLLVGDNLADHSGIYEKRGPDHGFAAVDADRRLFGTRYIVLPNPMYGNWLNELLRSAPGDTEHEKLLNLVEGF